MDQGKRKVGKEKIKKESKGALTTHFVGDHHKFGKPSITLGLQRLQLLLRGGTSGRQFGQLFFMFLGILLPAYALDVEGAV